MNSEQKLAVRVAQWLHSNIGQAVQSPNKRVIHTEETLRNLQEAWFPEQPEGDP